jgi:5'-3' exonuclease
VLPTLGGYLNEGGFLNLPRFERFMETLSQYELEKFDDIYSGLSLVIIALQRKKKCAIAWRRK